MAVRAIRGATQVDADDREQVLEATRELVTAVLERNELDHDDVISILFTATPDLVSEFPALAARELGLGDVPLMCATEIDVAARPAAGAPADGARGDRRGRAATSSTSTSAARVGPAHGTSPSDATVDFRGQVTLDGPSGTGKSSVARAVAARLGAAYLDTGAMYRAATVAVLDAGVDPEDAEAVARGRRRGRASRSGRRPARSWCRSTAWTSPTAIRGAEVTRAVSPVSAVPAVRRQLVDQQRALVAAADAVVVEGRDIGTVVLPGRDAEDLPDRRARGPRRAPGRAARAHRARPRSPTSPRTCAAATSTTAAAPTARCGPAADAVVVDSTDLDREAVVERVVELAGRPSRAEERA